ncbi:hypothetical protein ACTGJ9_037590 [Bradyrhizobium sp. RDM12]
MPAEWAYCRSKTPPLKSFADGGVPAPGGMAKIPVWISLNRLREGSTAHRQKDEGHAMMAEELSLSVFTIEVDRKPVVAFAARKYSEAEAICADERIRDKLSSARSGGKPLCDELATLRVRLANPDEKNRYREQSSARSADAGLSVYLVDLD